MQANYLQHSLVGHYSLSFDLPYLLSKSAKLGLELPNRNLAPNPRYWPSYYHDTIILERAGRLRHDINLDKCSRFYGWPGKDGNGANFYKMERAEQEAYLENDLRACMAIYLGWNTTMKLAKEFTVFDIETEPFSIEELEKIYPPFNPDDVKLGRTKDPKKIADAINDAEANYLLNLHKTAALESGTSNPIAIGYMHSSGNMTLDFDDDPRALLTRFWERAYEIYNDNQSAIIV